MWSVKFKFGVRRAQCEVWSVKCEVWSVKEAVRSEKCGVWSVKCGVWSLKFGVRRVQCAVWGVECRGKDTVGTGCLWTIGHLCLGNFCRRLARVYVICMYDDHHSQAIHSPNCKVGKKGASRSNCSCVFSWRSTIGAPWDAIGAPWDVIIRATQQGGFLNWRYPIAGYIWMVYFRDPKIFNGWGLGVALWFRKPPNKMDTSNLYSDRTSRMHSDLQRDGKSDTF